MVHEIFSDDLRVGIDSLGAQLISIKDNDGLEYIWQKIPMYGRSHRRFCSRLSAEAAAEY